MSRWTLNQRWYGRDGWMTRRIISAMLVFTMFFGPGFPFAAFANPDTFVGDAAIYIGAPAERVRPKILFLIDNSRATEDPASGSIYYPSVVYPSATGREPWDVFSAKNTGEFEQGELDNNSYHFEDFIGGSCAAEDLPSYQGRRDFIIDKFVYSGTYSSSGSEDAPNLKNGDCDQSPNGAVYAIGNYLNYLEYDPTAWNAALVSAGTCSETDPDIVNDDDYDGVCDTDDILSLIHI